MPKFLPSSPPPKGQKTDNQSLDLSDDEDEELREQLDMHSIIVSCINEEPLFTAEQVAHSHSCSNCELLCGITVNCHSTQCAATGHFTLAMRQSVPTKESVYICTADQEFNCNVDSYTISSIVYLL